MALALASFAVRDVRFGAHTAFANGLLTIDRASLVARLTRETGLPGITVEIARPGDSTRIVNVLDVVEPRVKVVGPGCVFPGLLGPALTAGQGTTHRLDGVNVVIAGRIPGITAPLLKGRPSVVDMGGVGARYSPFSGCHNVVISFEEAPEWTWERYETPVRLAALQAAVSLAEVTRGLEPACLERFALEPSDPSLPRVIVINQLQALGPFRDTLLYGRSVHGMLPTLIDPNEIFDGAIVGPLLGGPGYRNATALYQHHPVVRALWGRHARDLTFAGVVIFRGHSSAVEDKERDAEYTAKLGRLLGANGAIVVADGRGHSQIEIMMLLQACERAGIRTAAQLVEDTDAEGRGSSLIDHTPEADLLISTGNIGERLLLEPVDHVLGGGDSALPQRVDVQFGASNQLGAGRLRVEAF